MFFFFRLLLAHKNLCFERYQTIIHSIVDSPITFLHTDENITKFKFAIFIIFAYVLSCYFCFHLNSPILAATASTFKFQLTRRHETTVSSSYISSFLLQFFATEPVVNGRRMQTSIVVILQQIAKKH